MNQSLHYIFAKCSFALLLHLHSGRSIRAIVQLQIEYQTVLKADIIVLYWNSYIALLTA